MDKTGNLISNNVNKNKQIISLIFNIAIVAFELVGLIISFKEMGLRTFEFYTEDSNIFAMIACAVFAIYTFINLKNNTDEIPNWVTGFKYIGTCLVAVTFIVVVTVLAPSMGAEGYKFMMLKGSMLYHHFICPVLAMIALFLLDGKTLTKRYTNYAIIPTVIYAMVAIILNIAKVIVGPYPFLHVYEQPVYMSIIWCILIVGGAYLFAFLIRIICNKINKDKSVINDSNVELEEMQSKETKVG